MRNLMRALDITGVVIFRNGMASGNLVTAHMMVIIYWFPALVQGRGPTQSIRIRSNGSTIAERGCKGAKGILWFGFPTI